jgi:Flp pilus assembly protein TadG
MRLNGHHRKRRGQALAEMAVMVPFLIIGMMGFLDLGRAFYYQIALTNAVREAARFATAPYYRGLAPACNTIPPATNPGPNCPVPGDQNICDRVRQELAGTGFNVTCPIDVTISPAQGTRVSNYNGGSTVQYAVTVSGIYQFNFITPIVGSLIGNPLTLHAVAVFRTEY